MSSEDRDGSIRYSSRRLGNPAEFRGRYRAVAPVQLRDKGSFAHWLSERYCLYTTVRHKIYRGEIHHQQWPLQNAEAEFDINTVAATAGIALPDARPSLLFARKLEVLIWPLRRIE